ncbi:hypothetical protein B0H14DRAFT_2598058 [Mycena olivaceomarginata]|nr:hypothetical protein B0H14DRAFT_2598058 [Mycena olivaceomarginata]
MFCASSQILLRRKHLPPSLSPPRCPPATSSTPTQPRLSLQIPLRAVAPGGLALPVPMQGADTPLCGSHARPPGLGKLGDLRADATGAGWCGAAPAAAAVSGSAKHGVGPAECAWRCAGTH